jgi:hypothetical protein
MGLLANIFGVIALFRYWQKPIPPIWWWSLGLCLGDMWFTSALRNSIQMNGGRSIPTYSIAVLCTIVQLAIIVLGIASFF